MERKSISRKEKRTKPNVSNFKKLKLLITVVNRKKTEFFIEGDYIITIFKDMINIFYI